MRLRCLLLIVAVLAVTGPAWSKMPPNAFLLKRPSTKSELLRMVRDDVRVRDRYQRHYGMNTSELIKFFCDLRLSRLTKTDIFTVYNVPKSGLLRMRKLRLKKGSLVWVNKQNQPTLLAACGNPLSLGPTEGSKIVSASLSGSEKEDLKTLISDDFKEPPLQSDMLALITTPSIPKATDLIEQPIVESFPETEVAAAIPVVPSLGIDLGSIFSFAPAVAAIYVSKESGDDHKVVPEPATIGGLATGLMAIGLMRRWKRQLP